MNDLSYWAFIGTIYLILLTIQDYKNFMKIDDRKNYFMMGLSISVYSHFNYGIAYVTFCIFNVILINWFMTKYMQKYIGKGDINAISWIFLGFSIIGIPQIIWYIIHLIIMINFMYLTILVYKKVKKERRVIKVPFFPVFLFSFILNCIVFSLY